MSLTGEPGGPPAKFGISIVDHTAGLMGAFAIVAALHAARETGEGRHVDLALFDVHLSMLTYLAADYLNCDAEPQRQASSAHPYIVPSQLFPTRDGHVVVMPMADHMWPKLCAALGLSELAADPELARPAGRLAQRQRVTGAVAAALAPLGTAEAVELLVAAGVPAAPVNTVAQALADPQVAAREMVVEAGGVRMLGNPVKLAGMERRPFAPAPRLGRDSQEVLREAGLSEQEIESLCPAS
jgi:crotonobetainyl-CoA:carnitine CoA-transferase CaiB-like acyl-CoA transferase